MSKSSVLYVKGMSMSESERDEEEEDIWDDSKLNDAYDKALRIANIEVAKRVAMSTNTQSSKDDSKTKSKTTSHQSSVKNSQKKVLKTIWKAGMHCRAMYEGDGIEYEALLLRVINDKECIVRFLGYENSEIVSMSELKPSLGKTERTRQIEESVADKIDDDTTNHSFNMEKMECSDRPISPGSTVSFPRKKKSGKKKNQQKQTNCFDLPDIPMPNFAQLRNIDTSDMPIPPPPPMNLARSGIDSEDQAVSSMLLSWYMSGYYTGLYQGMKRAKQGRRRH